MLPQWTAPYPTPCPPIPRPRVLTLPRAPAVDRALYHALPDRDDRERYGTCAIVGNSGAMLQQEFGKDIDAHDMVYRFNQVRGGGGTWRGESGSRTCAARERIGNLKRCGATSLQVATYPSIPKLHTQALPAEGSRKSGFGA